MAEEQRAKGIEWAGENVFGVISLRKGNKAGRVRRAPGIRHLRKKCSSEKWGEGKLAEGSQGRGGALGLELPGVQQLCTGGGPGSRMLGCRASAGT